MKIIQKFIKILLITIGLFIGATSGGLIAALEIEASSVGITLWALGGGILGIFGILRLFYSDSPNPQPLNATYRSSSNSESFLGGTGVMAVAGLEENLLVLNNGQDGKFRVSIIRQSGYVKNVYECNGSDAAFHKMLSTFNRKKVEKVRVWENTNKIADVRMTFYHGRGQSEGKVIGGVVIQKL